jgi:tRNA(Ile)-lysidine synthase TilS/MesJ
MGNTTILNADVGDVVFDVLMRNYIPPSTVLVSTNGKPICDSHRLIEDGVYRAALIEGYDVASIRGMYSDLKPGVQEAYLKRRLLLTREGALKMEEKLLDLQGVIKMVESLMEETCQHYELVLEGDVVLVGLSGGVDSSSMLLALSSIQPRLPSFRLVAATFEDFDSKTSPTFNHAKRLATDLGIEHHVVDATLAQEVFHLKKPLREILPELMQTRFSHQVMYIDHHTTRRVLEVFAKANGLNKIALGLHTTDLIGGILNSLATGYRIGNLPSRVIGDLTYIYPLVFVPKKELHAYYYARLGKYVSHSKPNLWELNPMDRNFYYYVADALQTLWPGIEYWLLEGHRKRTGSDMRPFTYTECGNCGGSILSQDGKLDSAYCDVCNVLLQAGYVDSPETARVLP